MRIVKVVSLLLVGLFLIPATSHAQMWGKRKTITGQGALVKKTLSVSDFEKVGLGLNATLYVTQGNSYKVEIEAQENIINELNKEVEDGSWNIGFGDKVNARDYKKAKVWITMPTVKALSIGGSGEIIGQTPFTNLGDLKLSIAGSGDIEFAGDADDVKLNIAGSGTIKAEDLRVDNAKVSIAGSGTSYIHVNNGDLDVSIAGSGKVYYKGKAGIKTSIAGSGKVSSIE